MAKLTASKVASLRSSTALATPVFHVYVVENTTDGGRYVSVRKNISATAFWSLLCVGARDPNFDQPIHNSIRVMGDQNSYLEDSHHKITRVATYTSKTEAQVVAAKMIENNAMKARAYNATRPSAGASADFEWKSETESAAMVKAAKAKTRARKSAKVTVPATTEAVA
jgi:hypothetical protein